MLPSSRLVLCALPVLLLQLPFLVAVPVLLMGGWWFQLSSAPFNVFMQSGNHFLIGSVWLAVFVLPSLIGVTVSAIRKRSGLPWLVNINQDRCCWLLKISGSGVVLDCRPSGPSF